MMAAPQRLSWDIFCRVVDNFGDAALCWRLATQLQREQGGRVHLWIDRLETLHALHAAVAIDRDLQCVDGIELQRWSESRIAGAEHAAAEIADVVIETFGCGLPAWYAERLPARLPRPLWITLEYLSAETWVESHHGLPSPHPRLDVDRYFYFPGFGHGAGGVLREKDLLERRDAYQSHPAKAAAFWKSLGFAVPEHGSVTMSLFGYENPVVAALLEVWSTGPQPVTVAVTDSRIRPGVEKWLGLSSAKHGNTVLRGAVEVRFLPFLSQRIYDQLLWSCDWNFVRGEDSFVRAQWAARPLVWQIYPQADNAHAVKLEAFLDLYCAGLEQELSVPLRSLWRNWNGLSNPGLTAEVAADLTANWAALATRPAKARLSRHAAEWSKKQALEQDLAGKLADFCQKKRAKP